MKSNRKRGFTLVEFVTVLGIVALAVAVLAPSLVNIRQKARQSQCAANLRQIGHAWLDHEQAQGFLPSSGWGWLWTGDPDRGFGRTQPGGWAYDAVRFTEYADVAIQGVNAATDAAKAQGMIQANAAPIAFFHCPERRPVQSYPLVRNSSLANNLRECSTSTGCVVNRIDYQANSGNIAAGETGGPFGDRQTNTIPDLASDGWNGVTWQISEIRLAQVPDGMSKTICVGEKYLNPANYLNGRDGADDNTAFVGIDRDLNGYTASSRAGTPDNINRAFLPQRDRRGLSLPHTFGGPHESGINVVNLDSSVRFLSYEIDHYVFFLLGGRADGG